MKRIRPNRRIDPVAYARGEVNLADIAPCPLASARVCSLTAALKPKRSPRPKRFFWTASALSVLEREYQRSRDAHELPALAARLHMPVRALHAKAHTLGLSRRIRTR